MNGLSRISDAVTGVKGICKEPFPRAMIQYNKEKNNCSKRAKFEFPKISANRLTVPAVFLTVYCPWMWEDHCPTGAGLSPTGR